MKKQLMLAMYEKSAGMLKRPIENNSTELQVLSHSVTQTRLILPSIRQFQPNIILIKANSINYDTDDPQKELLDIIFKCKNDPRCVNTRIAVLITGNQAKSVDRTWLKQLTQAQVWDIFLSNEGRLNLNKIIAQLEDSPKLANINFLLNDGQDDDSPSTNKRGNVPEATKSPDLNQRLGLDSNDDTKNKKPDHYKLSDKPENTPEENDKSGKILRTFSSALKDNKPAQDIDDEQLDPRPKVKKKTTHDTGNDRSKLIPKIAAVVAGLLLVCSVSAFAVKAFANQDKQVTVQKKKPKLKTLLDNGDFDVAAKYYPNKVEEIDNKLISSDVDDKSYFTNKIYQTTKSKVAKFDDSYFEGKYESLVDTYDQAQKSDDTALTEDNLSDKRRLMLAYSCMKIGKFKDARSYAQPLSSPAFNKRINVYEKFYKANQLLKNQLLNKKISDNKRDKIVNQINENQKVLDKL